MDSCSAVEEDDVGAATALALAGYSTLASTNRGSQTISKVHTRNVGVYPVNLVYIGVGDALAIPTACRSDP
jgi:hypothetical protein